MSKKLIKQYKKKYKVYKRIYYDPSEDQFFVLEIDDKGKEKKIIIKHVNKQIQPIPTQIRHFEKKQYQRQRTVRTRRIRDAPPQIQNLYTNQLIMQLLNQNREYIEKQLQEQEKKIGKIVNKTQNKIQKHASIIQALENKKDLNSEETKKLYESQEKLKFYQNLQEQAENNYIEQNIIRRKLGNQIEKIDKENIELQSKANEIIQQQPQLLQHFDDQFSISKIDEKILDEIRREDIKEIQRQQQEEEQAQEQQAQKEQNIEQSEKQDPREEEIKQGGVDVPNIKKNMSQMKLVLKRISKTLQQKIEEVDKKYDRKKRQSSAEKREHKQNINDMIILLAQQETKFQSINNKLSMIPEQELQNSKMSQSIRELDDLKKRYEEQKKYVTKQRIFQKTMEKEVENEQQEELQQEQEQQEEQGNGYGRGKGMTVQDVMECISQSPYIQQYEINVITDSKQKIRCDGDKCIIIFLKDHHFTCAILGAPQEQHSICYYDPYGSYQNKERFANDFRQIKDFCQYKNKTSLYKFKFNTIQIQEKVNVGYDTSSMCGDFICIFIVDMMDGYSFKQATEFDIEDKLKLDKMTHHDNRVVFPYI